MKGIILVLTVALFAATSALYTPKIGTLVDCGLSGANIFGRINGTVETDPVVLSGLISTMDLKITLVLTQQTPAASVVDIAISRKRDNLALPCGADGVSGSCKGIPLCTFVNLIQTNPTLACPVTAERHDFDSVYPFTNSYWNDYVDVGSTEDFSSVIEFKESTTGPVFGCFEINFSMQRRA